MGQSRKWIGIVAALMLASGVCFGQDQDDKVRNRLKEMKGDDDQAAQVAEMELVAMGDNAVGPLKKIIDDGKDPQRAEAMKVYPRVLEKAGRLTRVSLDFDNAKAPDVFNELNKQCNAAAIDVGSGNNSRITIHREKVPYCLALAEICQVGDGTLSYDYSTGKTRMWIEPGSKNRPISEEWGNIVILDSVKWRNTVSYNGMKRSGPSLVLTLMIMMDPAIHSFGGGGFKDMAATDESGKALSLSEKDPRRAMTTQGMVKTCEVELSAPEPMKKIGSLKGKMKDYVGYDFETWSIEDVTKAAGTSHEFGPIKMEMRFAEVTGSNLTFKASLTGVPRPGGETGAVPSYQLMSELINHAIKVESADGRGGWHISYTSFNSMKETDPINAEMTITLVNAGGNPVNPAKMEISLPRKFDEIQVGFEFKDIELF